MEIEKEIRTYIRQILTDKQMKTDEIKRETARTRYRRYRINSEKVREK